MIAKEIGRWQGAAEISSAVYTRVHEHRIEQQRGQRAIYAGERGAISGFRRA
jgi:hypothetical protein